MSNPLVWVAHFSFPTDIYRERVIMDNCFGLEYHLVDSCNLKCAGCSHYSSLLDKKTYLEVEDIISDLNKLKDKVGDNLKWLRLLGGEPLIHPEITECLRRIRELFPTIKMTVVTNGLLLDRIGQEFYDICLNCRVGIVITDYGIIDVKAAIDKLKRLGISARFYKKTDLWHYQNIRLTEGKIDCFKNCVYRKNNNIYRDGKIYLCPHIAYIDYFNKYFNKNIGLNETDYIDLDEVDSFGELMERLRNAKPNFCYQYCNYYDSEHPKISKWNKTKKDINEFCLLK